MVILLQAQQVLACIQFFIHCYIYIRQQNETSCQPVSVWCALINEVEYFLFSSSVFTCLIQLLSNQVLGFGPIKCACILSQCLKVIHGFLVGALVQIGLGTEIQGFVA